MKTLRQTKYALTLCVLFLALFVSAENSVIVQASPTITLNTTSGQTGVQVAVSGTGFSTSDANPYSCLTGSVVQGSPQSCTFGGGSMSATFIVNNVPVGTYSVQVAGSSGDSASTTFMVVSHPSIQLSLTSGPAGATVSVTGSGFAPSDNTLGCTISGTVVPSGTTCTNITPGGTIAGGLSFVVASVAAGTYTVTVQGSSGDQGQASFTVTTPATAVTLNPTSGQTGVVVAVSGVGFAAGDGPGPFATCLTGSVVLTSPQPCTFNGAGVMSATFTVAPVPVGSYSVQVTGPTGDSGTATFTVVSHPSIALSLTSGPVGATVSVTGSGFALTDTGGSCTISGTVVAGTPTCAITNAGTVGSGTFIVANVPAGTYTVTVQGSSGDQAQASFTVTAPTAPTITFNPTSGPTATTVTVTGSGFSPADASLCTISPSSSGTVAAGPPTPTCTLSAGSLVASSFVVGAVAAATYTLTVQGSTGDFAQGTFTVTGPTITLTPTSGAPDTHVSVTGKGFELSDIGCTIAPLAFITPSVACSIVAGIATVAFNVNPGDPAGPLLITVTGTTSGDVASATFNVLTPTITLTPSIGQIGITVHVTGSGFDPTAINCFLTGLPVASQSCMLTGGSLTGTFVTGGSTGSFTITANPGVGPAASANFQLTSSSPAIALHPTSAQVGATVSVSGAGFSAGDSTCMLSGTGGSISSYTCAVSGGVLTASFVVANVGAAAYVITATGTQAGDTAIATLTVLGPTMTLSPSAGPAGITVHVSGTGFDPTAACSFLGGTPIATQTCTISGGVLTGSFVVNTGVLIGSYPITANPTAGPTAVANFQVTTTSPVITLSKTSAQVGATISVSGTGFSAGDMICSIGSVPGSIASQLCSISGGVLTASFVIANVATGPYTITATGNPGGDTSNSVTLTVLPPSIALNPSAGPTGITVQVTGSGFWTTASCTGLSASVGLTLTSQTCTLSGGVLTGTFVETSATAAFYTITATANAGSPATATAQFQLTATSAFISLNPASAHIGATVSVSGSGFSGADNTCTLSGTVVASGWVCSVSGTKLTASFIVDNFPPTTYTITAKAQPGGEVTTATLTVLSPSITLNPSKGPGGITVQVTGIGFYTTDTCTGLSGTPVLTETCSISDGALTGSFVTAGAPPGFYAILANAISGLTATTPFQLTTNVPTITLTPNSGPAGTAVTITGSGFNPSDAPGCSLVSSTPGTTIVSPGWTCPINTSGQLVPPSTFTVVSPVTPGVYTIAVTGTSGDFAQASFTVTSPTPTITLTPNNGPAGTVVSISGTGFNPADIVTCPGSITSSPAPDIVNNPQSCSMSSGQFTGSFTVNTPAASGAHVITVKGSTANDFATATFTVTSPSPTITLTPTGGVDGTGVTVSGSGFLPSDSSCGISSSPGASIIGLPKPCSLPSGSGKVSGSFIVIGNVPGTYTVTVTGTAGGADAASATFVVMGPQIALSPASGPGGTTVVISGSGFLTGDSCGGPQVTSTPGALIASATCTLTNGKLSASFTVFPNAPPGTYTITVQGSPGGDLAQANLVVSGAPVNNVFLTPSVGGRGSTVGVSATLGGTWTNSPTCSITGTPVSTQACTISSSGNVAGNFIVSNNVQAGAYSITLRASGVTGGGTVISYAVFIVQGAFIQLSDPAAIGQVVSGSTGTHVEIEGSFFPLSDTTCSISSPTSGNFLANTGNACSVFAGSGLFSGYDNVTGSFVVGNVQTGQYVVQVTTSGSGTFAQAVFNVTSTAFIQVSTICGGSTACGLSGFASVGQPGSGPIGFHVSVEGSHFQEGDTTCSVSSTTNGEIVKNGACSFFDAGTGFRNVTGSFIVGNVAAGQYVIQISGNTGDFAQAVFSVTAGAFIQLSGVNGGFANLGGIASGPIGTHVNIEGSQFLPNDGFNSATCSLSSVSNGNLISNGACSFFTTPSGYVNATGSFTVGNVAEGQYVVRVSGSAGDSAQAVFNVTAGAFIQLSGVIGGFVNIGQVASGPTGTHVAIEGSQFLANDAFNGATCSVSSSSGSIILNSACSFFKAPSGYVNVTGSFIVGNVNSGQYVIRVSGSSGDSAQAVFSVSGGPFIQLSAGAPNGFVSLGQVASGPRGTSVAVEGSNFLATDTSCTLSSPTGVMVTVAACSTFTGANGLKNVTGSFTVGNVAPGQYVIQISGNGGDFAQSVFNVTGGASLTLSPASGQIGTHALVNGTGFLPTDTTCTISSPGSTLVLAGVAGISIKAGSGTPGGSFTVGNVVPGQYVIRVTCTPGGDFAESVFSVTVGSLVTLSPATGRPGTHIAVNGTGFLPTDVACTVTSPGSAAVQTGSAGCVIRAGTGVTAGSFILGNVLPGQYVIQITGNTGDFGQALLNVTQGPVLTVSPGTGRIGDSISVNGTGFLTTDSSCTLVSGISNSFNPILADSQACAITVGTGIVRASFIIGTAPPGQYVLQVNGASGGDSAQAIVNVIGGLPSLQLVPTNATNGATVNFYAYGLNPSDTGCNVQAVIETAPGVYAPNTVLISSPTCSITSPQTAQGSFIVSPYATTDKNWTVQILGTPGNDIGTSTPWTRGVFNVTASVLVTPPTGSVNSVFTFTGSGFSSVATTCTAVIVPPWPGPNPGCYLSAGIGTVTGSVVVPSGTVSGTYGIAVTDNTGKETSGFFTVGTPSALLVLNPASVGQGEAVGFAATGLNPSDTYCVVTSGTPAPWTGSGGVAPTCSISGGYASGAWTISTTASGGYYLITVTGCNTNPTCSTGGDFAQNFLGLTLATTITTFSTTSTTATSSTSLTTTSTSVATSYSYSSTTVQTTGIFFTTYSSLSIATETAQSTQTVSETTTTTQTQTSASVTTTTGFTTVSCGPLPCGFAIGSQSINVGPFADNVGLLAVLLLIVPMLLRRLFS